MIAVYHQVVAWIRRALPQPLQWVASWLAHSGITGLAIVVIGWTLRGIGALTGATVLADGPLWVYIGVSSFYTLREADQWLHQPRGAPNYWIDRIGDGVLPWFLTRWLLP